MSEIIRGNLVVRRLGIRRRSGGRLKDGLGVCADEGRKWIAGRRFEIIMVGLRQIQRSGSTSSRCSIERGVDRSREYLGLSAWKYCEFVVGIDVGMSFGEYSRNSKSFGEVV